MTWITLTFPVEGNETAAPQFYLRADTVTEILPSEGETIVRTATGGQHICSETAEAVLALVKDTPPRMSKEETDEFIATVLRWKLPPPPAT